MPYPFIKPGDIVLVPDDKITFVEQDLPERSARGRTTHDERPLVVLQNEEDCDELSVPAVLVSAGSHLTDTARNSDLVIAKRAGGFAQPTVLLLGQIFPILKSVLQQGRKVGSLNAEEMESVRAVLARNFGMI